MEIDPILVTRKRRPNSGVIALRALATLTAVGARHASPLRTWSRTAALTAPSQSVAAPSAATS